MLLFEPRRRPHEPFCRRLWMRPLIHGWVMSEGKTNEAKRYFADVRQMLKRYVIGDAMFDDDDILKPMKGHPGLYEFRIAFQPQSRIFGGFTRIGEFVATHYRDRNALNKEGFSIHINRAKTSWNTALGDVPRSMEQRSVLLGDYLDG